MDSQAPVGGQVLIVDDDPSMVQLLSAWLTAGGFGIDTAGDGPGCFDALARTIPDCVLLDVRLPGSSGVEVLVQIRQRHPRLPVIMLTADKAVDTVVAAMQAGAWDYLAKPLEAPKLQATVRNAVRQHRLVTKVSQLERESDGYEGMIAHAPAMMQLFRQMERVAATDVTVLIHGESGTGKELVARAIHRASGRRRGPFIAINCAAIPESLAVSELFGHEKGAFTGADQRRIGRLEQADGGTLFLDEIAELDLPLQAKLLRALQERRFHRVGGSQDVTTDFRLLAATHRRLEQRVKSGAFREDLFFRVAVFELEVPPLRARDDDVVLLARHFLPESLRIGPSLGSVLRTYPWPGNVRELANAIEHASVVATDGVLRAGDLPRRIREHPAVDAGFDTGASYDSAPSAISTDEVGAEAVAVDDKAGVGAASGPDAWSHPAAETDAGPQPGSGPVRSLVELEREAIIHAMASTGGNVSEACRLLGIGRTTLYRKLERYRIDRPSGGDRPKDDPAQP